MERNRTARPRTSSSATCSSGDGTHSAVAEVLRFITPEMPFGRSMVAFMDGDVRLATKAWARSIAFFFAQPDLGALTTNNAAIVARDH